MAANKRDSSSLKVVSPRLGLSPLGRVHTNIIALTKLEPKEISHKIQVDFVRNPMFQHFLQPFSDIITNESVSV
jgi:hypothetical protein